MKTNCDCCGTVKNQPVYPVGDFRGNYFGLVCLKCCDYIQNKILPKLLVKYGEHIDKEGVIVASPYNSPSISNMEIFRAEVKNAHLLLPKPTNSYPARP